MSFKPSRRRVLSWHVSRASTTMYTDTKVAFFVDDVSKHNMYVLHGSAITRNVQLFNDPEHLGTLAEILDY